jgi:glycosyltransferase involved in cell wall biosynthesis
VTDTDTVREGDVPLASHPETAVARSGRGDRRDSKSAVPRTRIALVASLSYSLVNFRLELIKAMVAAGHEVIAFAPERDADVIATLNEIGVQFVAIPMSRTGMDPFTDLKTLSALVGHFRRLRPDVVLPYTMKPVIYGGIAARLAGVPRVYALMTGLGFIFSDDNMSTRKALIRKLSILLYRLGLRDAKKLFVYNSADLEDIERHKMAGPGSKLLPVDGSGVDLDLFTPSPVPDGPARFLLVSRLLSDKGIREFVEAARIVRARYPDLRFEILGPFDPNPAGIQREEVDAWVREGSIVYLGETRDVRPYLAGCSAFVLPTYYREGIPRTLLEALATGRAIVTTDMPGARETVIDGENGMLVEPRDAASLANALEKLAVNHGLLQSMGQRSLELARNRFDVKLINRKLLAAMELM